MYTEEEEHIKLGRSYYVPTVPRGDKSGLYYYRLPFGTFGWLASPVYCIYNSRCRLRRYLYQIMLTGFAVIVVRYSKTYLIHLTDVLLFVETMRV